jgi:hypothetical protein
LAAQNTPEDKGVSAWKRLALLRPIIDERIRVSAIGTRGVEQLEELTTQPLESTPVERRRNDLRLHEPRHLKVPLLPDLNAIRGERGGVLSIPENPNRELSEECGIWRG